MADAGPGPGASRDGPRLASRSSRSTGPDGAARRNSAYLSATGDTFRLLYLLFCTFTEIHPLMLRSLKLLLSTAYENSISVFTLSQISLFTKISLKVI